MKGNKFQHLELEEVASQTKIITQFISELNSPAINKLLAAQVLFNQVFELLSFNFDSFIACLQLTSLQKKQFISYLLYALYYYEIPLAALKNIGDVSQVEHFLLALAAESIEPKKIQEIIKKLPLPNQLHLINYCSLYVREGTRTLLHHFSMIYKHDSVWNDFLKHLQTKYYSPSYLNQLLLESRSDHPPTLRSLIDKLEIHAEEQVVEIRSLIPPLIHSIIQSPLAIFETLKKNGLGNDTVLKNLTIAHKDLESLLGKYRLEIYTLEEMKAFFRDFGLKDHILNTPEINNPTSKAPLSKLLKRLFELFLNPSMIPEANTSPLILFVLSLCRELYTFHREPHLYNLGLDSMVFVLSTRGKRLKESPWLYSILMGLGSINEYLQRKNATESSLNPIIIFDQATPTEFKKNSQSIRGLSKEYKRPIWHLSNTETLKLAELLGIVQWIRTSSSTEFGYGGSRNCALLLAPVLAEAFRQGMHSLAEILHSSPEKLKIIYNTAVLGKQGHDLFIHLGEDDVAIPVGNIFSDVHCAAISKQMYFSRHAKCCGRSTHEIYPHLDLNTILEMPLQCFYSWKNSPFEGGMKAMLTKPKFCLPISLGNEELHVILPHIGLDHFQQANEHLAGTRFPHKNIPLSPWDGLLEVLCVQLPYRFHIAMSSVLTDSNNNYGRNIFPWNDADVRKNKLFHSLEELWNYASSADAVKELKKRFWNNFEAAFQEEDNQIPFRQTIDRLINVDLAVAAPLELIEFYKSMQEEAQFFVAFAIELLAQRKLKNPNFVQSAKTEIEERCKIKISETNLAKGLLELVHAIEKFGNKLLILE